MLLWELCLSTNKALYLFLGASAAVCGWNCWTSHLTPITSLIYPVSETVTLWHLLASNKTNRQVLHCIQRIILKPGWIYLFAFEDDQWGEHMAIPWHCSQYGTTLPTSIDCMVLEWLANWAYNLLLLKVAQLCAHFISPIGMPLHNIELFEHLFDEMKPMDLQILAWCLCMHVCELVAPKHRYNIFMAGQKLVSPILP